MNIHSESTEFTAPGSLTFPSIVQLKTNPTVKVWAFKKIDALSFAGVVVSSGDSNDHKLGDYDDRWSPALWEHTTAVIDLELSN